MGIIFKDYNQVEEYNPRRCDKDRKEPNEDYEETSTTLGDLTFQWPPDGKESVKK